MMLDVYVVQLIMGVFLPHDTKLQAIIHLAVAVPVGIFVYAFLAHKLGLLEQLFGNRFDRLLRKLRLKK